MGFSIQEIIERLGSLEIEDKKYFSKSLNEDILKLTIEAFKNML